MTDFELSHWILLCGLPLRRIRISLLEVDNLTLQISSNFKYTPCYSFQSFRSSTRGMFQPRLVRRDRILRSLGFTDPCQRLSIFSLS